MSRRRTAIAPPPAVLAALCLVPFAARAVVSTNSDFNSVYFQRRSVESRTLDDTDGFSPEELARLASMRRADRIRKAPMEDIAAMGAGRDDDDDVAAAAARPPGELDGDEGRWNDGAEASREAVSRPPGAHTFRLRAGHVLLAVFALAALGVVVFGGRKRG